MTKKDKNKKEHFKLTIKRNIKDDTKISEKKV